METLGPLLVVLHLLGMAAIVGGWLASRTGSPAMAPIVWGARAQLVTGLALVGLAEAGDGSPDHTKVAVKLVVAVAVAACAEIAAARARRGEPSGSLLDGAGILAVVNVLVAVLWSVVFD